MSLRNLVNDLKKIQTKALNKLTQYPKNKELQELTKLLSLVIKGMEKAAKEEELENKKCAYESNNKKSTCSIENKRYCSVSSKEQGYTSCVYITSN